MQLHPDILVEQEDDQSLLSCNLKQSESAKKSKWTWLVMGRIIYLCSPWNDEDQGRILYHHENVAVLLAFYRRQVPQIFQGEGD